MEKFSTCWEDRDMPYLQPLSDAPGHGDGTCFCDTQDKEILGQVLNNYDQETVDFYRWKVEYDRDQISEFVASRSGIDLGRIQKLEPLERGESERIYKLKIVGSEKTLTVGKELEIRRLLSESHLKSSAFDVEYLACGETADADSDWDTLVLHGQGWGHGVGLCQIGAAVMASQGYTYKEILSHYYPETELK
jgi:SpoIID/LytB domain protein